MINEGLVRTFAEEKFKQMPEDYCSWNIIHIKDVINALRELTEDANILERLVPLAWVHDLGKIKSNEDHAKLSIDILEENNFKIDSIDKECILNHGSKGNPIEEEAKIFKAADGISLFYPESVLFKFWTGAKEGKDFEEIRKDLKELYEKYRLAYKDMPFAIKLLESKFGLYSNH